MPAARSVGLESKSLNQLHLGELEADLSAGYLLWPEGAVLGPKSWRAEGRGERGTGGIYAHLRLGARFGAAEHSLVAIAAIGVGHDGQHHV